MYGNLLFLKSLQDIGRLIYRLNRSTVRAIQGVVVSIGAPSVWLVIRLLSGYSLKAEMSSNIAVYLYMLFGACFVFAIFGWHVGSQEELLKSQASHDDLTGLYNSRHFSERLSEEIVAIKRHDSIIALVLLDLDHFKRINDEYGHIYGNKVLRTLGLALKAITRANETVYRIGGDEFCIILKPCDWIEAHRAATRFLERIRITVIKSRDQHPVQITASLGIAVTNNSEQLDARKLLGRADKAMYKAKAKGRNRIEPVDYEIQAWRSRLVR